MPGSMRHSTGVSVRRGPTNNPLIHPLKSPFTHPQLIIQAATTATTKILQPPRASPDQWQHQPHMESQLQSNLQSQLQSNLQSRHQSHPNSHQPQQSHIDPPRHHPENQRHNQLRHQSNNLSHQSPRMAQKTHHYQRYNLPVRRDLAARQQRHNPLPAGCATNQRIWRQLTRSTRT